MQSASRETVHGNKAQTVLIVNIGIISGLNPFCIFVQGTYRPGSPSQYPGLFLHPLSVNKSKEDMTI
ncbi:hypothetical protein BJX68DRAFT_108129 [Aspergillus pseudodeflectus]|uniref:Uncharacterized protein n=1 Tax=Aspergillus pseudodeflectus TaxID=176178 RepID=A0ABR4K6W9_9EURO